MKVLCVGRNYVAHIREMGGTGGEPPVWFWKPESAIVGNGEAIQAPAGIGPIHHEVELALRLGGRLKSCTPAEGLRAIAALTVANDVTARALQDAAKKGGLPWAMAKGFDTFLPLGEWVPYSGQDLQDLQLRLTIGGTVRQESSTALMVTKVGDLLAHASTWTTLQPGDILLTGTPHGVGPMEEGDVVVCEAKGIATLANPVRRT